MRAISSPHDENPLPWQSLRGRVHAHLVDEGMSAAQADRISREIIAICAANADSLDPETMNERAFDEARTLLQTWEATRREQLLGAA